MATPVLRPPEADDAPALAAILNKAGGGVISYLLDGLIPGLDGESVLAAALRRDQELYSPDSTLLVEKQGRIAAMLGVCPAEAHVVPPALSMLVSGKKLKTVRPLLEAAVPGSLHINVFWLDKDLCGEADARMLLLAAEERAKSLGLPALSVFCRLGEEKEIAFFTASGFCEHRRFAPAEFAVNGKEEGGLLLRNDLA